MIYYMNLNAYIEGQRKKLDNLTTANIPERGIIERVLSPRQEETKIAHPKTYSTTRSVEKLYIDHLGIMGERHRAALRPSTGREKGIYGKSRTPIRQHRHVFAVSSYDCEVLSTKLGVAVTPELLGANIVIKREDGQNFSLSDLPENTNLLITAPGAVECPLPPSSTLRQQLKQQGCVITGNAIAHHYGDDSLSKKFIDVSRDNRGIVCSVEQCEGVSDVLYAGQTVFFKFPTGTTP